MSSQDQVRSDSYAIHWVVTIAVILTGIIAGVYLWNRHPSILPKVSEVSPVEGVDWFQIVRIPEVPDDAAATAQAVKCLESWLSELRRSGFQPMLLSTVLAQQERGNRLPKKTVVLLFRPGRLHTYETLAPILQKEQCPAVWLTDQKGVEDSDHKYLSRHVLNQMTQSGLWDVIWYQAEPRNAEQMTLEWANRQAKLPKKRRWTLDLRATHKALNRFQDEEVLYHLHARYPWSGEELVHQLLTEVPVEGPAYLTVRQIGSRVWSLAVEAEGTPQRQPFGLEASMNSRLAALSWASTSGKNDHLLELNLLSQSGDVWVLLRSNQEIGQAIRIGFTTEQILVEQDHEQTRTRLAAVPWPELPRDRLMATILLQGNQLQLNLGDQPVLRLDSIREPMDSQGHVELVVYDKVRGAAGVKLASLIFVPLQLQTQARIARKAQL
ncbi:MAG: hypothetical protein HYU33_01855 [Candidatus Omnitrophica bacterium]|nr:hypothetical protein [Candidatus Omnitrophota bacterium]MBI3010763.1 hypothetical protein [Candidatus Omnitrophota bacterium]